MVHRLNMAGTESKGAKTPHTNGINDVTKRKNADNAAENNGHCYHTKDSPQDATADTRLMNDTNHADHNSDVTVTPDSNRDTNIIPMVNMNTYSMENGKYDSCSSTKDKMLLQIGPDGDATATAADKKRHPSKDIKGSSIANSVAPMSTWRLCSTITILLLANILNYIDRYTIAGELSHLDIVLFHFCKCC